MSWFSTNYEKAVLAAAIALALGLAYLGWDKYARLGQDFGTGLIGSGNNQTAIANADLVPKALQSMTLDRTWTQALDAERPVDLFTGIPLFIKNGQPDKPIDLIFGEPVHPPIPNQWWLDHRLDPGFGDSPYRDPDSDGFSNKEEYEAKTDPNNNKSIPELISRLMYVKDESLAWVIRPGYGSDGKFPFNYEDSLSRRNRVPAGEMIAQNGMFFLKEPMANRFKLVGMEVRKELKKKINLEVEITIVRIEDQRFNKQGRIYEVPSPLPDNRKNEFVQYDRTAVLSLEALGLNGKTFKVEENTAFALPPGSAQKDFMLKQVTPESVVVEYPDLQGNRKSVEILKGSLPRMIP